MSPSEETTPDDKPAYGDKPAFEKKPNFLPKRPHIDRPERFEDFIAWTEARRLANRLYEVTDKPEFAADAGLRADVRRHAAEVMSHLASGVESHGEKGFARGLSDAKSAVAACRSLLYLAIDRGYLTEQESTELQGRTSSVGRIIGGQLAKLKRAETTDAKKFGWKPGGGYGAKKPYGGGGGGGGYGGGSGGGGYGGGGGGGGYGGKKPYGKPGGGFKGKKPFKPKTDE